MARGQYDTSGVKKPIGPNPPPDQPPSSESKASHMGRGAYDTSGVKKPRPPTPDIEDMTIAMGCGSCDTSVVLKPGPPGSGSNLS